MLPELLPLMTDTVQHWLPPVRDIVGNETSVGHTEHRARVIDSPGKALGKASQTSMPDAAATVWLIDHPRAIAIGDVFKLPLGELLKVARVERRAIAGGVLHKVYLT